MTHARKHQRQGRSKEAPKQRERKCNNCGEPALVEKQPGKRSHEQNLVKRHKGRHAVRYENGLNGLRQMRVDAAVPLKKSHPRKSKSSPLVPIQIGECGEHQNVGNPCKRNKSWSHSRALWREEEVANQDQRRQDQLDVRGQATVHAPNRMPTRPPITRHSDSNEPQWADNMAREALAKLQADVPHDDGAAKTRLAAGLRFSLALRYLSLGSMPNRLKTAVNILVGEPSKRLSRDEVRKH